MLRDAIVQDALGGRRLPLRWRRRVGKAQARYLAACRKVDQQLRGSHLRWSGVRFQVLLNGVVVGPPVNGWPR